MTRTKRIAFIVVIFLLPGCATATRNVWSRDSGTLEEARKDVSDCRYDVVKYGKQNAFKTGLGSGADSIVGENHVMIQCMTHRGYRFADPAKTITLKEKISRPSGSSRTKAQITETIGPLLDRGGFSVSSFVLIRPMDTGPLGMEWYPQSRMDVKYQEAQFYFSPDGINEKVSFKEMTDILPVR
ncbi:MAG: hypothetical protein A2Z40_03310 [Deltaproteobacteria bacterium RBG_19FT_COMBO_60_16]|nr:MAG: hypothetical protein A2Z40_03310 [Deltaproteobacteria bacterium RBG_19FT_COMBO_60_16]